MTLILDMVSGEEYQGEEMSCPRAVIATHTPEDGLQGPAQHLELQLAMVELTPPQQKHSFDMAGIDIDTLIKTIKD